MIADYHIHTPYCGHAQGRTVEYIEAAIEAGIPEIGFADHLGRYYLSRSQRKRYWDWGMNDATLARYYTEVTDLRDSFADQITIKIGLEVDYIEGAEELLEPIVALYPFDFLLGSIHCLPRFSWRHLARNARTRPEEVFIEYFNYAQSAAESGLFDILAHLDFVWRYVAWPTGLTQEIMRRIDEAVAAAAKTGTCIELNTNGYVWSAINAHDGADPFEQIISSVKTHKACITLGSDAHTPATVGKSLDEMAVFAVRKGTKDLCLFSHHKARKTTLG